MPMRDRAKFLYRRPVWFSALLVAGIAGCTPPAPPVGAPPAPPPKPVPAVHTAISPAVGGLVSPPRPRGFRQVSIVLYQPDAVLKARLGDDAAPLAAYIRQIDRHAADVLDAAPQEHGFSAALVIVLKPGGKSRAWLVTQAKISPKLRDGMRAAADSVPPLAVQGGPVAFAIIFDGLGGGGKPVVDATHPIPIPAEWREGVSPLNLQGPAPLLQQR